MWLNKDSPVCTSYDWFSTPEHLGVKCQSAIHGLFNVSIYQLAIIEEINKVPLKKFYIALLYSAVVVLWFCFFVDYPGRRGGVWVGGGGGGRSGMLLLWFCGGIVIYTAALLLEHLYPLYEDLVT